MPYALALLCLCFLAMPVLALARAADLCDRAAERAARETGVPLDVLLALTRAETGRASGGRLDPWPWAVNQGGQGQWFDSAAAARDWVEGQLQAGVSNIDIGCFQLNHRWHSGAFPSLDSMFDPEENALYAAHYLAAKYDESGDWETAAGAYHSATEVYARRYTERFREIRAGLAASPRAELTLASADAGPRVNRYPLLQAGGGGRHGSLVPRSAGGISLFARLP
ncbi:lytic transglycosylase [Gemmobacter nanjingensis]|uniref:Lytic transglycosylase n=1 Tax=Gemmobacter nanjingensis TaxID=488454 RepID=A0ABQ3FNC2_9RHOB|nr:transglycosylase SLT domain-containing protein [Gemmobacter nanjingensis]GHC30042.1 lytic transglycosylase [Gemmobacter nanjingensis]